MKCDERKNSNKKEKQIRKKENHCYWTWPWGHCWHKVPVFPEVPDFNFKTPECCNCGKRLVSSGASADDRP